MGNLPRPGPDTRAALRMALIYALFAGAWILFSDRILLFFITSSQAMARAQTLKGIAFVLVTALLVYFLFKREISLLAAVRRRLRQSEEKYRVLVESSPDLIYRTDLNGRIIYISPSVQEMAGYTEAEAIGMDMAKEVYVNPEDRKRFLDLLNRDGAVRDFEARLVKKDGTLWWASTNAHFYRDEQDRIIGVEGATRDVTQKKESEQALLESEQQLRAILEANPDPMVLYDLNGYPLFLNRSFTDVFGWTHEELEGRRIPFVPEGEEAVSGEKIAEIFRTGQPLSFETRRLTKDGRVLDIILSAAVVKDTDQTPYGMVVNITDISEKKMLESQYEQAQRMESLGTLAGGIAHDFNNYLTGILGYLDLAKKYAENPSAGEFLEKALASSDRARSLTHQLLTFSKGGAPVKETHCLDRLLMETTQFALSGANVSCEFNIQEGLWTCDCDRNQISQVIENIVINAHHAMPGGGRILVSAENENARNPLEKGLSPGKYVRISVQDTGTGIPGKYLKRIFDPFFSTKQTGSGLGLAASYSIVRRHGGIITVASEQGLGSLFNVYLPSTGRTGREAEEVKMPEFRGIGRILIMDDEAMIRDMLEQMLNGMGFEVVAARDGEEALALFKREAAGETPFTAVILDLTIPGGMGGKETVSKIREMDTGIPVFVASGYSDDDALASPDAFGFTASLEKPFLRKNLGQMLKAHLSQPFGEDGSAGRGSGRSG